MKSTHIQITGIALAILSANLFSSKVILVKLAYAEGASPMQVLGIRMATALPFFLVPTIIMLAGKAKRRPTGPDFAAMTALGLLGYYLASVLDFHGMVHVTAGLERLLLYLYPSFLVVIRSVSKKSLPGRYEVMALLVAYGGAAFVFREENQGPGSNVLLGTILILGAALSFALYLHFSQKYVEKFGSRLFASYSTAISCIAILIHAAILGEGSGLIGLSGYVIFLCVLTGLISTVFSTYLMHQSIAWIGAAKFGILGTSGIICPLILGALFFAEPLTLNRFLGIGLVLASVVLLSRRRRKKDPTKESSMGKSEFKPAPVRTN